MKKKLSYAESICCAIDEEMDRDSRVIFMGEDVGFIGGLFLNCKNLFSKYGSRRIIDTPISENSFVGAGIGAAITGLRPIVEVMYIDFITLAMDQIINQAAKIRYMFGGKMKVPIVIRTQGGAGKGNAAQHSQSLEMFFCGVPGLKVVMPSCPYDAKGLLKASIRDDNPVIFIEHKMLYSLYDLVPEEDYIIEFGKADIKRTGTDITIIAVSYMVLKALSVAEKLENEGISCEVIDPRTLYPLDVETIITSIKKTNNVLIVCESYERAGTGSYLAQVVMESAFDWLDNPIKVIGSLNCPIPYAHVLEEAIIPNEERIIKSVKEVLLKN